MTNNIEEVNSLISKYLYKYIRYAINKDDFELFKNTINTTSLLNVNNPRFIQGEIHMILDNKTQSELFFYDRDTFENIFKEIKCFEYLLRYLTIRNFNSVGVLSSAYELFEKNLEKYLTSITQSEGIIKQLVKKYGTDRDGILKMVESTISSLTIDENLLSIHEQLNLLFISLKLHFTFYCVGAFIIFEGKQQQINSAKYLKELWDHTHPEDAIGINLNESPVLFDPVWLTYLHFYGGRNTSYWTKFSSDFSLRYDDYHDAENYLYQYYLLTITRCIQMNNSSLSLPSPEKLDSLMVDEPYVIKEFYNFADLFKIESKFLFIHCEELIRDAHKWDILFDNHADESFLKTKEWIQDNISECEKLTDELKKRMTADENKIKYFSQIVLEEYRNTSFVNELAEIKKFDEETDKGLNLFNISKQIVNLDKRWFFKDDDSHPDHIFTPFGRLIAEREKVQIFDTIINENLIEKIKLEEIHPEAIFNKIKEVIFQMSNEGFFPTVIFIPREIKNKLPINRNGSFPTLKIDEDISLKIVNSKNNWKFDEIVILDMTAGIWTYCPVNNTEDRVCVEITPNEKDELNMKILVKTRANYTIVKPDAVKIIELDFSVDLPSPPSVLD